MKKKKRSPMDSIDRSHPHTSRSSSGGAGDFFICFSARPSSSSATCAASTAKRATSTKALMSPNRCREPSSAPALSASLSRRLRNSGSVKGGQSPMFPGGVPVRKKGLGFEAAEPSSPKVTCIGQVRVKAKKKVKSTAMARERSRRGRDCCSGRNQSWVHQIPVSICEAVRGIGSEFNCFVFCGGRAGKEKEARMVRSGSSSSCGAVVAKWLLAVQENGEEVNGEEKIGEMGNRGGEMGEVLVVGDNGGGGEEEARVSVCVPPRNALLLMRCRSDPVRMAALANRFWGSPVSKALCEEEREEEDDGVGEEVEKQEGEEVGDVCLVEMKEGDCVEVSGVSGQLVEDEVDCKRIAEVTEEELSCRSQVNPSEDEAKEVGNGIIQNEEKKSIAEREEERLASEERRFAENRAFRSKERGRRRWKEKDARRHSFSSEIDARRHSVSSEREAKRASFSIDRIREWSLSLEKTDLDVKPLTFSATKASPEEKKKNEVTPEVEEEEDDEEEEEDSGKLVTFVENREAEAEEEMKCGEAKAWTELPDCLLMMMYEPKLSMEVSKETWVCGNDFLHWRPHHSRNRVPSKPSGGGAAEAPPPEPNVAAEAAAATLVLVAPPKPSARPATVAPYEPLVLTRCKSEPVRSSARLAPDACFWKDRHRPIGEAGIGF